VPQLLTPVDREAALRLARLPDIGVQEKKDGERLLVRVAGNQVTGGNKKGLTTVVPPHVADDLLLLGDCVTDGEKVGAIYHVFDLLSHRGTDLRELGYYERYLRLATLIEASGDLDHVRLVPLVTDLNGKLGFIADLELAGKEGYVLKRLDAMYRAGEGTTQVKCQFRKSASFIAGAANPIGRHSVQLFVVRADGSRRDMGFVSIPAALPLPTPGDVVSVQYLYVHPSPTGKLHQPVFQGLRPAGDADANDCLETKLKVAAPDEE
jgi:bifunctional non-homologous end joining protein LigD